MFRWALMALFAVATFLPLFVRILPWDTTNVLLSIVVGWLLGREDQP